MRPASSPRFSLLCAVMAAFVACSPIAPQIIINRSAFPIHVRLAYPSGLNEVGTSYQCRFDTGVYPLQMTPEKSTQANDTDEVVFTAIDLAKCQVEFDIPAGYKVVIDLNATCDDYSEPPAEHRSQVPSPSGLRIEGKKGIIDSSGWQVPRHFRRQKDDSCLLVYE